MNAKAPKVFSSRYAGWCSTCKSTFDQGTAICSDCRGYWCHAKCYRKANQPQPPPPSPVDPWALGEPDEYVYTKPRAKPPARPYETLENLPLGAPLETVKSAYRRGCLACHPDRCPIHGLSPAAAQAAFVKLTALYVRRIKWYSAA